MSSHWLRRSLSRLASPHGYRVRRQAGAGRQNPIPLKLESLENRALLSTFPLVPTQVAAAPAFNPASSLEVVGVPVPGSGLGGVAVSHPILGLPGIDQGQASSTNTSSSDQTVTPTLPLSANAPGKVFLPPILKLPTVPPKGAKNPVRTVHRFAVAAVVEQPSVDTAALPVPAADPPTPAKATLPLAAAGDAAPPMITAILDNLSSPSSGAAPRSLIAEGSTGGGERTAAPTSRRSLLAPEASTDSALDTFFLEFWDQEQLLFPDAGPPIDETLFPDGFPAPDDMPGPGDISSALEHSL